MSTNPIKPNTGGGKAKSPKDPQACCDWANERLLQRDSLDVRRWVVTGDPHNPIRLARLA